MTQHVITAAGLTVRHRSRDLLAATDVELRSGEVRALVGEPGHGHTALALILGGRLTPDAGTITMDGSVLDQTRRAGVALVDVPGVTEPDEVVPIGTILGEELALAGQPARRTAVRAWAPDVDPRQRTEDLPAAQRVELLMRSAALRARVRFLVVTLPDRWGVPPAQWEPVAAGLAERGLGVLVTVGETSRSLLTVPAGSMGGDIA